jgi:hypothetical protein
MPLKRLLACALAAALATPVAAESVTSRKMTSVYLLAHAGAILDICLGSPEASSFPQPKLREISELGDRLGDIVRFMGTYYRDADLHAVYASTKLHMATDTALRFHVKKNHENCGERSMAEMRTYVADNEALIEKYRDRVKPASPAR